MPYDRDRYDRDWRERDRGPVERAGDEVRSWFGDDEARHRRERDDRYDDRNRSSSEPVGRERYRDYGDRYGRPYSSAIDREREAGRTIPVRTGSQEFGPEGYGSASTYESNRRYAREWPAAERWRVPGPYAGRGPKGYQRSDERIREEISDRLTAHGEIDASDIEVRVQGGEITLIGFVDSRHAKHAAEDLADDVAGVREVHNQLRIRSHADDVGVGRTSVLGLAERETQTAETARSLEQSRGRESDAATRSRARTP